MAPTNEANERSFEFIGSSYLWSLASSRVWAVGLLVFAAWVYLVFESAIGMALAIFVAVPAVVMLVRPPRYGFFALVSEQHLVVQAIVRNRIDFKDIVSVAPHMPRYGRAWMIVMNEIIRVNRLFGGTEPLLTEPNAPDDETAFVTFRKPILIFMPFPPFIWIRSNWRLKVHDAPVLRDLIAGKIAPTAERA